MAAVLWRKNRRNTKCKQTLTEGADDGCRAADQADRTGGGAHALTDAVVLVGAFFAFQCQLFGHVGALAAVLFELGAADLRFFAVAAGVDGGVVVADGVVADRLAGAGSGG